MTTATAAQKRQERQEYADRLRKWLPPGTTVYTVLRNVSRSGMSRRIDLYAWVNGEKMYLSGMAAAVMGDRCKGGGIIVSGCGMDMGFHVVYNLAWALWGKAFKCIGVAGKEHKKRCPSNDHSDHGWKGRTGTLHSDGGYALRQEWI